MNSHWITTKFPSLAELSANSLTWTWLLSYGQLRGWFSACKPSFQLFLGGLFHISLQYLKKILWEIQWPFVVKWSSRTAFTNPCDVLGIQCTCICIYNIYLSTYGTVYQYMRVSGARSLKKECFTLVLRHSTRLHRGREQPSSSIWQSTSYSKRVLRCFELVVPIYNTYNKR